MRPCARLRGRWYGSRRRGPGRCRGQAREEGADPARRVALAECSPKFGVDDRIDGLRLAAAGFAHGPLPGAVGPVGAVGDRVPFQPKSVTSSVAGSAVGGGSGRGVLLSSRLVRAVRSAEPEVGRFAGGPARSAAGSCGTDLPSGRIATTFPGGRSSKPCCSWVRGSRSSARGSAMTLTWRPAVFESGARSPRPTPVSGSSRCCRPYTSGWSSIARAGRTRRSIRSSRLVTGGRTRRTTS